MNLPKKEDHDSEFESLNSDSGFESLNESEQYTTIRVTEIVKEEINKNKKSFETADDYLRRIHKIQLSFLGSKRILAVNDSINKNNTIPQRTMYKLSEMEIGDVKIFPISNWNTPEHERIIFAMNKAKRNNSKKFQLEWIDDGQCSVTRTN